MAGRREIPRELSIYINDQQVVNSLAGIGRAVNQTRNAINNLNRNSETYNEDLAELGRHLDDLIELQQQYRREISSVSDAYESAAGSWRKFRDGLLSGDLESAREGLLGLRTELKNLITTAWEFVSTPLGAAIAVMSGIAIGTKKLIEFNQELEKSNNVLRSYGVTAYEELTNVRSEILATAQTFEKEFDEIASKANSLSKTYGISMSEANRLIAEGLANGGQYNEEFLDSLGEYDEFFKRAGYSANEFIDIINKGYDLGIYSDKLPDALKEADLALKEQTKATRDALENAFGASFSDDILARIAAGKTTTKEALEEIAAESQKTQLSQQQQAQLTADIFKGAGEDAGGSLKILEAISKTTQTEINASTKAQLELLAANEKLNKAQSELFEIQGFGAMWDEIKAKVTNALADIIFYFSDLKKDIAPLIELVGVVLLNAFLQMKFGIVSAFTIVGFAVKTFFNYIKFVFDFIKAIITGDFKGAIKLVGDYFSTLGKSILSFFGKVKNIIIETIQGTISSVAPLLEAIGINVEKLKKRLESLKSKDVTVKTTSESKTVTKTPEELAEEERLLKEALAKQKAIRDAARQKEEEARRKALEKKRAEEEKAAREELDRLLALAKAKTDLAKAELDFFIATNRSKIDSTKKLTPEIIAEETLRLDRIKDAQLTALAEKRLNDIEKAKGEAKSAEELALLKQTIDYAYETQRQNLELSFLETTTNLKKQYEEEQKVLKAEQLQADNELALAEAQSKYEEDQIKQQQDYQKQLSDYKKLLNDKIISEDEYNRFRNAAANKQKELEFQRQLELTQSALGGFNALAGALGEMFGQSKELAIAQASISGAQAILSIWTAPAALPQPYDAILKGVLTAASVIQTGAQIKNIKKQKAPKTPKFYFGGYTGSSAKLGVDEFGPMTGIVHDHEYVIPKSMTQNPRYANTIAWLENERTGKNTRRYFEGGATSGGVIPEDVIIENDNEMKLLLKAVLHRLDNPVAPNLLFGYEDAKSIEELNKERIASDQNSIVNE
ncbi:phage tail tape measure protein, TP901 family [Flavobacterium sp. F52]|nr:phage tail tape measure protein, TP901 family [Flavobacterium sp. F52]